MHIREINGAHQLILTVSVVVLAYGFWVQWASRKMPNVEQLGFTAISGFFEHDYEPEGPHFRATTVHGLGLLERDYSTDDTLDTTKKRTQWERFMMYLDHLNREGASKYKLFFVVRHGEGAHNVKEAQVGRAEWERYWARLQGDDTCVWFDAHLTEKGQQHAEAISKFLKVSAAEDKMPVPARHYTSPLSRCLETTKLAFSGLGTANSRDTPGSVVVKEGLRERMGIHTCDRRRTRSWIQEKYPDYEIEANFPENDELWEADRRESLDEHMVRVEKLLTDIFEEDSDHVVSLTAHSGAIRALYNAIGHKEVWVDAGAMVPVLIKADAVRHS